VFSSAQFAGIFVGGVSGGWLLEMRPPDDLFLVCAVVVVIWLAVERLGVSWRS